MRVAIIDDGVFKSHVAIFENIRHYYVDGCMLRERDTGAENEEMSHGTACAQTLSRMASRFELIDIAIFNSSRASVKDLVVALEWCCANSVSVINMSFGTVNYLDLFVLQDALQRLINQGVFLVAAHSNRYLKSYPAIYKGVFGVRLDCGNSLSDGEFGCIQTDGLSAENCFVAHNDKNVASDENFSTGNSYAAPVITAHIVNYIQQKPYANFRDVLGHLLNQAVDGCTAPDITNIVHGLDYQVTTSMIGFRKEDLSLFMDIKNWLIDEQYEVVSFVDFDNEKSDIPINFYCLKEQGITQELLSTLGLIYDGDVFLFCLDESWYRVKNIYELIDMKITEANHQYQVESQEGIFDCGNKKELVRYIIDYFN